MDGMEEGLEEGERREMTGGKGKDQGE